MVKQELRIDYAYYSEDQCSFEDLKEASKQLTTATEEQFATIKKETWFNRVFNMITFSKENNKRMAKQIQSLAQAQQLLVEVLVRLSNRDARISDLVVDSFEKIEKLSKNDVMLAKRINQLEKRVILGICKETDIEDLSDTERVILGGLLFHLMHQFAETSQHQREFANKVLNYLDIEAREINVIEAINSVKYIDKKKKIFTCCLEYCFLHDLSFDFTEEIENLIDYFDFGKRTINETKNKIQSLYDLRGINGFMDRYGNYDDLTENFYVEMTHIEQLEGENDIDIELEEFNIDNMLYIPKGEMISFKNKIVHINAFIHCHGDIEFDNCLIHYNETEGPYEIRLEEGANIKISHSKVKCHGLDETPFITGTENNNITLDKSTFEDCAYFIEVDTGLLSEGDTGSLSIDNCHINNPIINFINFNGHEVSISNSTIHFSELPTFYKKTQFFKDDIFHIRDGSAFIKNCVISADENLNDWENEFDIFYLSDAHTSITNCSFINVNNCIIFDLSDAHTSITNCSFINVNNCINSSTRDSTKVSECVFEQCNQVIRSDNYTSNQKDKVTNSLFKSCEDLISGKNILIESNQFIGCKNKIISGDGIQIQDCEFFNITNDIDEDANTILPTASISFNGYSNPSTNKIEKCIFNGVDVQGGFLVQGNYNKRISEPKIIINNCDFKNLQTKRESGKVIKENDHYYGLFNRRVDIKPVKIENCTGLDKVNKENGYTDDFIIKLETSNGNKIGSSLV